MLKRFLPLILISVLAFAGCKNNRFEITGKLKGAPSGEYILLDELRTDELITVDSAMIGSEGSYLLSGKVSHPSFFLLKSDNSNFITMLIEPGQKIKLDADWDTLGFPSVIEGSEGTKKMADYNRQLKITIGKLSSLHNIYMDNIDKPELPGVMERLDSMAQAFLDEIVIYTKDYINTNLSSLISLVALFQQVAPGEYVLDPISDLDYFIKVDSSLFSQYPSYGPVQSLHEQVANLVNEVRGSDPAAAAGASFAPEIALPNPEGDTIRLSSTRGKVVLLDFWAAWCSPCRRENPNLVNAYNKYKGKGFEIFQVSIDKTREAWINGIKEDKLGQWIHVSDLLYWNSSVIPLYGLEAIPANFLLDREGRVIASNLRGEQLEKKLSEIFDN